MTRRDRCYLIGRRAGQLGYYQAAKAWFILAADLEAMGERDLPKFNELLGSIRVATIAARQLKPKRKRPCPADVLPRVL